MKLQMEYIIVEFQVLLSFEGEQAKAEILIFLSLFKVFFTLK